MASLIFVDLSATFEPRGDNMVMTITSGDTEQSFVMPRSIFTATMGAGHRATRDWFGEQQGAQVVPFAKPKRRTQA